MPGGRDDLGYEDGARGARAAAEPVSAADCPIEALHEEHFRQRQNCSDMEMLAATRLPRPDLARTILLNLCRALPLHYADEDDDLFPRLRQRCLPEDDIDGLVARLEAEHRETEVALPALIAALACMADGALPAPEDRAALLFQAQAQRRHMILENAVLLPLARARLAPDDRAAMLARMRARRAAPPAPAAPCAAALARLVPTQATNPNRTPERTAR
jgi:hypothetical protein